MPHTVFLTGATGFVGQSLLSELSHRQIHTIALSHTRPVAASKYIHPLTADLFDPTSLARAMSTCSAVIHLVGIIFEKPSANITFHRLHVAATQSILTATQSAGIPRYIHMSALGSRPDAPSTYHRTKYQAEQLVRATSLNWTLLRPSLIHGPSGEFMQMEASLARQQSPPYFFMPYFNAGFLGTSPPKHIQPIYVQDVARAFADSLTNPATSHQSFNLAGPTPLTWPEFHRTISTVILGHPRPTLPIPTWSAKLLTHLIPQSLLPFNRDQIQMSQEDNTTDLTPFVNAYHWSPRSLDETLPLYATSL